MHPITSALRSNFQSKRPGIAKHLRRQSMQQHGKICCQKCLDEFSPKDPEDPSKYLNPLKRCELHHIGQLKNHSHFGNDLDQLKKALNRPRNLAMLCKLCHSEFHDLYEDKESRSKDRESFQEFMSSESSGDYLQGYLLRQKQKKKKRQQERRKHLMRKAKAGG